MRFQHFQVAHHFRQGEIELVVAGVGKDLRRQLGGSQRAGAEQLEDALLPFFVEEEKPIDDSRVLGWRVLTTSEKRRKQCNECLAEKWRRLAASRRRSSRSQKMKAQGSLP